MCQNRFPSGQETKILQKLGRDTVVPQLPLLEHFKIVHELNNLEDVFSLRRIPSSKDVFAYYLAIARLVLRYKETLRVVEIQRNEILRTSLMLHVETANVRLSLYQRTLIQECLAGFQQTKLETLHIAPILDEGDYPWTLGWN